MNPNHHPYSLGGGPNLNLLDNMLMAAGFQATDQPIIPKPSLVPQYTYAQDMAMHQHAMNLVQPHVATSVPSDPVHVIVYQNEQQQQQQPISYKIPQLGTTVVAQDQFVVNEQAGQISRSNNHSSSSHSPATATSSRPTNPQLQAAHIQQPVRHIQSPAERKKDIVAQAMQEQKIFEENNAKLEPAQVKQEPGVVEPPPSSTVNNGNTTTTTPTTAGPDVKPVVTGVSEVKTPETTTASTQQRRPYQRTNYNRQQIMPRLQILEDEDDGMTCRLCLASFWYKSEIHEHLKTTHSIADPDKYDREEKEKKLRRIREEQQRIQLAKKQREERERRLREAKYGKSAGRGGKSGPGTIRLTSPGARPPQTPGQRPSFQYRDGAFICDLCKESFSDGNDMVTHWKSHVKKQQAEAGKGGKKGPGRGSGVRGRPPKGGRASRRDDSDSDGSPRKARRLARGGDSSTTASGKKGKGKRGDKGKPRWTAYLLWSTRKRRDVVVDHPDWTFAEIAKWISEEWKKVESDDKDELQKEAEEMNELGIRKLPRDDDGPDLEKETTDEDSDFEEGYRKKQKKPIMLKIKKDAEADGDGKSKKRAGRRTRKKDSDDSDNGSRSGGSDWEPEAEVQPPARSETRSGRQRKRPSFFQEFESQENNLDNILEEFEKQQKAESLKPRLPKPEPKEKKPRKPREKKPKIEPAVLEPQEEEVEVLRSGRTRKKARTTALTSFFASDDEDERGKGASSDDEDFEPPEEPEIEAIEDADDLIEDDDELMDDNDDEDADAGEGDDDALPRRKRKRDMELPPKKRGRPKKILTDAEIEEATRQAMDAKPVIEITKVPRPSAEKKEGEEEGGEPAKKTARKSMKSSQQENEGFKVRPTWVNEALTDSEDEDGNSKTKRLGVKKEPVEGQNNGEEDEGDDGEKQKEGSEKDKDDAAAKESHPVEETPEAEAEEESGANPLDDDENPLEEGDSNPLEENQDADDNPLGEADYSESVPMDSNPLDEEPEENGLPDPEEDPFATGGGAAAEPSEDPFDAVAGVGAAEGEAAPAPLDVPLTEEDLLTGPAHNLDDSQYKPDYNDSNFDEIFK